VPASLLVPFRSDTLSRLTSLESGSATSITTTGSGNAITSLTKSGSVITANKELTFALASHTHTIAQITGLQGVLDLKAPLSNPTFTGNVTAPTFIGALSGNVTGGVATNNGIEYLNTLSTSISAIGWYRVFVSNVSNGYGSSVILNVNRAYNIESNESYTFSINVAYSGAISITQLSGRANVRGISKIRVDYVNSGVIAVDIYYSLSTSNRVYISGSGTGKFQAPALIATPTGSTVEFGTVNGVKSSLDLTSSTGVNTPKVDFGNGFTIEPSGTELVFKYNGVIKQRMLSNGTILATGGITALST